MDVGDHTTTGNSGLNEAVEFFVTSNSELKMAGSNSLDLERAASVSCEFKNLSGEVLKNSGSVDCRCSTNSVVGLDSGLQESMNTSNRELK